MHKYNNVGTYMIYILTRSVSRNMRILYNYLLTFYIVKLNHEGRFTCLLTRSYTREHMLCMHICLPQGRRWWSTYIFINILCHYRVWHDIMIHQDFFYEFQKFIDSAAKIKYISYNWTIDSTIFKLQVLVTWAAVFFELGKW